MQTEIKVNPQTNDFFTELGVVYIGQQKRWGDYSLDMYNDIHTGSTYLRLPGESVVDMVDRIRMQGKR